MCGVNIVIYIRVMVHDQTVVVRCVCENGTKHNEQWEKQTNATVERERNNTTRRSGRVMRVSKLMVHCKANKLIAHCDR